MGEWKEVQLQEIASARGLIGGPFGSNLVNKDYSATGVPVIRGANLAGGRLIDFSDVVFVSEDKVEQDLAGNMVMPGDLVFTQRGTLGQVAVIPKWQPRAVVSQSQMRLRVDETKVDSWYVYYWDSSPDFLKLIDDRAIVSGVPHINLGILAEMPLPLPPLDEQRRIAGVLGALDDLIETNQHQVSLLRDQIATLFRSLVTTNTPQPFFFRSLMLTSAVPSRVISSQILVLDCRCCGYVISRLSGLERGPLNVW